MRRLIWSAFLSLASAQMAWAETARPETLDDTLLLMREQFLADPRVSATDIDVEQRYISFQIGDGSLQISLPDTIHDTLQNAHDDAAREKALLQFIDFTISASQSATPEALPEIGRIFPVIRPIGFGSDALPKSFGRVPDYTTLGDENEEELGTPFSLPFTADMATFFVEDSDQFIQFVTIDDLAQLEITPAQLAATARENLQNRDWGLKIEGGDGLHILSLNGDFETSFMLNTPFWQGVSVGLKSIVAVVAARDLVLFVDGSDAIAVENLRTLVAPEVNQFPNPISTVPLKWENGVWRPLN